MVLKRHTEVQKTDLKSWVNAALVVKSSHLICDLADIEEPLNNLKIKKLRFLLFLLLYYRLHTAFVIRDCFANRVEATFVYT